MDLLERKKFTKNIGGHDLIIETSDLAKQANAAVTATYGDTTVMATVVMEDSDSDRDYLPLSVDFEEKFYSVGRILGSRFMRREGRPSEEAVLSGRVIDRTIRPLFDHRIRRPIQVVATVLSYDGENDPDFVALMAASTALSISDIPWGGPVAAASVAKIGDSIVVNPKKSVMTDDDTNLRAFFSGTDMHINMIELGGKEVQESEVMEASREAMNAIKELIDFQKEIISKIGKEKIEIEFTKPSDEFVKEMKDYLDKNLEGAVYTDGQGKSDKLPALIKELKEQLEEKYEDDMAYFDMLFEKELDDMVHKNVLESDRRVDGRALDEVRELYCEVGLLPRTHGSGLFVRGDTQALAFTTLGGPGDAQLLDTIRSIDQNRRFMLHYNFPPFSVGEARSFRGPGRRDIGHGALAKKAIEPLMPSKDEFPYTVRVVSEILSSNGSSSMATVSASSLSLMDAGVPIKSPAAGIAMGLITGEDGTYKVLTDIQGPEDHYGDMDLKVAGTKKGITAMQMDVKIQGITFDILQDALKAAQKARLHILEITDKVISEPRAELSKYAPRIYSLKIPEDKIGEVIGPGGKMINSIIEKTGVESIDIDDDGTVFITAPDGESADKALREVKAIAKDLEVGDIVEGNVVKLLEFGAIVELEGGKSGLVHISEIKEGFVKDIDSVLKVGDKVRAKVIKVENGKTSLSIKQAGGSAPE